MLPAVSVRVLVKSGEPEDGESEEVTPMPEGTTTERSTVSVIPPVKPTVTVIETDFP